MMNPVPRTRYDDCSPRDSSWWGGFLFIVGVVIVNPDERAQLEAIHLVYALVLLLAGTLALYFGWSGVKHDYKRHIFWWMALLPLGLVIGGDPGAWLVVTIIIWEAMVFSLGYWTRMGPFSRS